MAIEESPTVTMDDKEPSVVNEEVPSSPKLGEEVEGLPATTRSPPRPSAPSLPRGSENLTASATALAQLNAARRGGRGGATAAVSGRPSPTMSGQSGLNPDILAKMKAFTISRQGAPPVMAHSKSTTGVPTAGPTPVRSPPMAPVPGGAMTGAAVPPGARPQASNWKSDTSVPGFAPAPNGRRPAGGLSGKRQAAPLSLAGAMGPIGGSPGPAPQPGAQEGTDPMDSVFNKYSDYIDTRAGTLNFKNKAVIHGGGIEFSTGQSFSISLDEVDRMEELGKGNYGTVFKVRHSRPHLRKPGLGVSGIISRPPGAEATNPSPQDNLSGVVMAMKEIRLELDENKFAQIIMELDILHRCVSPFIIDFYGAFFQEGAVYICVEYMDGGSVDRLYEQGIPESILRKITLSTIMGLKTLKDDHNIIHRDVKPTNILANTKGQVKICDFGVSGNLVASIAKTNIGCQSYMAPERIAGGGMQQGGANSTSGTYSVQSDVWSLGLSIIECAMGRYPYPPETYNNIFSQLHAIVDGEPPTLPDHFSEDAQAFVRACLNKSPQKRPSYSLLLRHPWLASLMERPTGAISEDADSEAPDLSPSKSDTEDEEVAVWVKDALERRLSGQIGDTKKPALHAVALDAVAGSPLLEDPSTLSLT